MVIFPNSVPLRNKGSFVAFMTNSHGENVGTGDRVVSSTLLDVGNNSIVVGATEDVVVLVGDTTGEMTAEELFESVGCDTTIA
jgi:hypothetical protein